MTNLESRVWEYSQNNPEGFTIDLETFTSPEKGFCVAYLETQDSHSKESLTNVINHALKHNKIIGGWFNTENNKYYFDSIKLFSDREKAIKFAIENKQIAIFDLKLKEVILV